MFTLLFYVFTKEKNILNIIFLDIDGVLNGYNKWTYRIIGISKLLHISASDMSKYLKVFEVKEKYVRRLAKIVRSTDARIIMSSSWRNGYWDVPYISRSPDQKRLTDLLNKYDLHIMGITPHDKDGIRENEITQWLTETTLQIDNFVILDDESYDLRNFVGNALVQTSSVALGDMICGLGYEDTGLKRKHVKQAIKILTRRKI